MSNKGRYPCHRRSGGIARKNRCFRVYLDIPEHLTEDDVIDSIQYAVQTHMRNVGGFDKESVRVTRQTPKYGDLK